MSEENPRTIRNTLRQIGYAAAFVSGSAAAVYTLSSALRRHDLSAIWMLDRSAAPPPAIQRELCGEHHDIESDEQSDNEAGLEARDKPRNEERRRLEAKMSRAVRSGDMQRVRELAEKIQDIDREQEVVCTKKQRFKGYDRGARAEPMSHKRGRMTDLPSCERPLRHPSPAAATLDGVRRSQGWCDAVGGSACYAQQSPGQATPQERRQWVPSMPRDWAECDSINRRTPKEDMAPIRVRRGDSGDAFEDDQLMYACREDSSRSELAKAAPIQQVCAHRSSIRHLPQRMAPAMPSEHSETDVDKPVPPRASSRTRVLEAPISASVLDAERKLMAGDLVKAECPFTRKWHDATIRAVRGRGLIEVRWHDPGTDKHGRPFSRYGDVWADKVHFVFRKDGAHSTGLTKAVAPVELNSGPCVAAENVTTAPDALCVGDSCFACGRIVEVMWFKARVLGVRSKSPPIRIEYLETFDGNKEPLLLPQPRKAFVCHRDVRRDKPSQAIVCTDPPKATGKATSPDTSTTLLAPATKQPSSHEDHFEDNGEPIDEDLMCSVCGRPDDEPNMLICECKKGYHTYCLVPKLTSVPEGEWRCPQCSAAGCA